MRDASKFLLMSNFFEELQRRKVYRVAAAYIIAAGFIIQIGSAVFPAWELPNWTLRLVVVLLLIGFPIALILSWAYDVTAQGIRATPTVSAPGTHRRRNLILLIATGVIVSAAAGFFLLPRASARKIDKSIAVLPFQNLSDEKENAYFADGMQDDILTNLSKIGDLKVISRMSVMSYRGEGMRNAREIGKTLGVATLLEGSVRRIGNRVRVNVQLIDADNDEHIWAEDYDRDLTDVFAIQTDLAQKIASALQAKLSPNEKALLDHRPTQNPDAYLLFVQAHGYASQKDMFRDTSLKAEPLFEQAIKLNKPSSSIQTLPWPLPVSPWWRAGSIIASTRHPAAGKKRAATLMRPCDCNRIFPKAISRSGSLIIMATAITSAPWPNSTSPDAPCRTSPKLILPSAPFSGVRASGRNQPRIWKKPPLLIRKTQAS